jgi:triosephosphate isomerase (TIM)
MNTMYTFKMTPLHRRSYAMIRCCLFMCTTIARTFVVLAKDTPKRKFIGANWKCNLETIQDVDQLVSDMNRKYALLSKSEQQNVEVCVLVPYVFIDRVRQKLNPRVYVGSQNVFEAAPIVANNLQQYKHTGTVTANMLQTIGCDWVLLGHSDRRNSLLEKDIWIGEKVRLVLDKDMGVVLTIGELLSQRQWGQTLPTLKQQLQIGTQFVQPDEWHRIVIAYEPVWAIGDGAKPCSPEEAQRILSTLRSYISEWYGEHAAMECRFTYTGSVDDNNCISYSSLPDVDGLVLGRASLDTTILNSIIRSLT